MIVSNRSYAFGAALAGIVICTLIEACFPCGWIRPEFGVIFVSIMALRYGAGMGAAVGAAAGIVTAAAGFFSWSVFALIYAGVGIIVGVFLKNYNDRLFIYFMTVVFASVFNSILLSLLSHLPFLILPTPESIRREFWLTLTGNLLAVWPVMWLIRRILGSYCFNPLKLECG